ncbi:Uracil-DNA glycosylase [Collimonas arenae]|uniref:Type-4 uracil-DNA glycosylase n=1 Tax=Collimonas arenae TaxID=279058 RepID=A0A0A1FC61_9BURK|nr:uracil-DNA glycosylase [Collimonas arenae]AIY41350.1 Uracil-DNA glycosylase [Collimonas arenae]
MNGMTRRSIFLDEIGLGPLWLQRESTVEVALDEIGIAPQLVAAEEIASPVIAVSDRQEQIDAAVMQPVAVNVAPVIDTSLPAWNDDDVVVPVVPPPPSMPAQVPAVHSPSVMDWPQLQTAVAGCTACGLCRGRKNTVFGVGNNKAKWLFIGEGPGRNEDIQGEPFVGPAGKLLDNILLAMGLARGENAYIANIVKCRPTDATGRDRPPAADEVAACLPYLQRQIELIQPTVLVALGKTAALSLLGLDPSTPVSKLRGSVHRYAERPLIVTYHPAYLLRQLADKGKVWSDLCLAMSTYAGIAE